MTLCFCGREVRGFGYSPRLARMPGEDVKACSMTCLSLIKRNNGMIDPEPHEALALSNAHRMVGVMIEEAGTTDLTKLSDDHQVEICWSCILGYQDSIVQYAGATRGVDRSPPTPNEKKALNVGHEAAGEFMASLNTWDLADLNDEQQAEFCQAIVTAFQDEIRKIPEDAIPF